MYLYQHVQFVRKFLLIWQVKSLVLGIFNIGYLAVRQTIIMLEGKGQYNIHRATQKLGLWF